MSDRTRYTSTDMAAQVAKHAADIANGPQHSDFVLPEGALQCGRALKLEDDTA
jgi:hypothetical protein